MIEEQLRRNLVSLFELIRSKRMKKN